MLLVLAVEGDLSNARLETIYRRNEELALILDKFTEYELVKKALFNGYLLDFHVKLIDKL